MGEWQGVERRESKSEVAELADVVEELNEEVRKLGGRLDRQWNAIRVRGIKAAMWLVMGGIVFTFFAAQLTDHHVKNCMTFGSVPSEQEKHWCDVLYPFHDHPQGGISDERLIEAVERAVELIEGQGEVSS